MAGKQAIPNLKESCVFRMQLVVDAMPSCSWIAPDGNMELWCPYAGVAHREVGTPFLRWSVLC